MKISDGYFSPFRLVFSNQFFDPLLPSRWSCGASPELSGPKPVARGLFWLRREEMMGQRIGISGLIWEDGSQKFFVVDVSLLVGFVLRKNCLKDFV